MNRAVRCLKQWGFLWLSAVLDILTVSMFSLLLLCLLVAWRERRSGELQFLFGYKPICILSGSMEDSIHTGAIVLVKAAAETEIKLGDIVLFQTESGYVTHRLVGIDEAARKRGEAAWLITKGDANSIEDPQRLEPAAIKGKVVAVCNAASKLTLIKSQQG